MDELEAEIRCMVRSGFYDADELLGIVCEELYEPGELDEDDVAQAIAAEFDALRAEQATWPEETDCDRLSQAFETLWSRGVIALENAGYTQDDGYDDVQEAYSEADDPESIRGYCYYHGQDLERAVQGDGLYLSFGPMDPAGERTVGLEIGRMIVEELGRRGLRAYWNGAFDQRIFIRQLDWKRRV